MNLAFALQGILGIVLAGALAFALMRRFLWRPAFFPYTITFFMRACGAAANLAWKFKFPNIQEKISPELIQCLRNMRASDMAGFRDAYLNLESLPTVAKGMRVLGLRSIFEVLTRKVSLLKSPYTHPLQTPHFFIPGVPAKAFYDPHAPGEFPFTSQLEASYPQIRAELQRLLDSQHAKFRPYAGGHGRVVSGWNNFYFYLFDKKNEENCALCPETARVLASIPRLEKTMIMFAALNPHASLEPHTGPSNGILRVHLPLIVPDRCKIKVGSEERTWKEGKVMIFDDSFVHEVHNHSDHVRLVLFFSIWHPCFADAEIPDLEVFSNAWKNMPITKLYEKFQHRPRENNLVIEQPPAKPLAKPLASPPA